MLLGSASGIPPACVPDALRPLARDGVIRIPSHGPHYEVTYVAPFALAVTLLGLAALTGMIDVSLPLAIGGGGAALVFGSWFVLAAAYTWRGSMELGWNDGAWVITKRLWRWSRVRLIRASQIRHVEVFRPSPGEFGPYVLVHFRGRQRAVRVASSLCLPADVLEGLRDLLATRDD
jgi:hypothetical protein